MYRFHATIHVRPPNVPSGPVVALRRKQLETLAPAPDQLHGPFPLSFETAHARLEAIERMHVELDGSFVWSGELEGIRWQLDGHLYDLNERLIYVDLKGDCPQDAFDRFLSALGWPETQLLFQLQREAAVLGEGPFRTYSQEAPQPA